MEVRRLLAEDLPALEQFWETPPWSERASDLRAIAAAVARDDSAEHRGLCAVSGDAITGVALFRFVAGAVLTGEIECVAGTDHDVESGLLRRALDVLRSDGARLTIAEYPGADAWGSYEAVLLAAGFRSSTFVEDYFADGVPLRIAVI